MRLIRLIIVLGILNGEQSFASIIYRPPTSNGVLGGIRSDDYVRVYRGAENSVFILEISEASRSRFHTRNRRYLFTNLNDGHSHYTFSLLEDDNSHFSRHLPSLDLNVWEQRKDSPTMSRLLAQLSGGRKEGDVHGFDFEEIYKDALAQSAVEIRINRSVSRPMIPHLFFFSLSMMAGLSQLPDMLRFFAAISFTLTSLESLRASHLLVQTLKRNEPRCRDWLLWLKMKNKSSL